MTGLERPTGLPSVQLPPRAATHGGRTEVLVVGGGPAGIGAATGAAAAGADVVLVERYGFLGGNATAALVMPLMSFHNEMRQAVGGDEGRLLPTDHGEGEPVVAGVLWTLLDHLVRAGGAIPPDPGTGYTVPFDPELFKLVTYDMLAGCGVRMLLHSFASDLFQLPEGGCRAVFETKSGPVVLDADVVVDCTGDGDLAAAAGAPFEVGRPEDGLTQPMTLMFRVGNVDRPGFLEYVHEHPDQWRGVHGLWDLIRAARDAGELDLPREDVLFFATPHPDEVSVNSTRVGGLGISVWDLTRAELATHRQLAQIANFLRTRVPGFSESYVIQSGVQVGVRETRRILGDYLLTGEDVLGARSFADVIARGAYPVDIHNPNGPGTILRRLPQGCSYDIPLRSLLPRDVDNLLVAGRCISGDHVAHSSYRIMPISMATGQAAGVCAALAAHIGKPPREIPAAQVQRVLRAQGASLPT
ncbi:FAD-dependent oxidoreductase [Dactylosporangium sp. NPDC051485]|uniref:FAD-dependent oxidoreductase n=1 Tax=Dactylosporangium sp. NPDC051485 TaxID=3154846 RepID=UPI00341628F8